MHKSIKEIVDDKDQKDSSSLPSSGQSLYFRKVADKIKSGELKIAIYGLGHVGSAMASVWLRAGAHVLGVDVIHEGIGKCKERENTCSRTRCQ